MKREIKRRPLPPEGPIEVGSVVMVVAEPHSHASLHRKGDLATVKSIKVLTPSYTHVTVWLHKWLGDPELLHSTAGPFYPRELRAMPHMASPIRKITRRRSPA